MAPQARDEPRLAEWKLAECCCKATAKARSLPQSAHSPIRCCSRAKSEVTQRRASCRVGR